MLATPPDYFARATWEGKNLTQLTALWESYVAGTVLATTCPKLGIGYFYYPQLGATIRGARAKAHISKGESFCSVPVQQLLSEYTVGNSSLLPVVRWFDTMPSPNQTPRASGRRRRSSIDDRTKIVLYMLRELARDRAPKMPYLQVIQSHDVSGVPALWPEDSPRWQQASAITRAMAGRTRAHASNMHMTYVAAAVSEFPKALSEGLGCTGDECPRDRLKDVYSWPRFLRLFTIVSARDWVLPVDGTSRAFLAPQLDLLNFGQVGIRAEYDSGKNAFVAIATQPIEAGTEMLFYYGSYCREGWTNLYGFAPEGTKPCAVKAANKLPKVPAPRQHTVVERPTQGMSSG